MTMIHTIAMGVDMGRIAVSSENDGGLFNGAEYEVHAETPDTDVFEIGTGWKRLPNGN